MSYPIPFSTQQEETMSSAESSSPASPSPSPSASAGLHCMDDLRKVFARYDADGDGRISASELADVLRSLGSDASPAEVRGMIAEMDADGDGFVDLQEFADFHRRRRRDDGAEERELREAFDVYDLDRNGLISAEELHRVLRLLGEKCSVKDCSRMIRSFDDDGDGSVNFEEFKKMMSNGGVGGRKSSASGRGGPSSSAA
nr:PREDICTED: probable calcium-binding protein CML18 [Musa acuminata subsp. malaccensis]